MMWPAARDFCVAQDIFSQEYWRISRKNDAAHRKKARCPGALGVFRYTLCTDFVLFGIFQKNRCISTNFASIYYADCRLSLLSAQKGKCSVSGELFLNPDNIVCHMKVPKEQGGHERYSNLVLLHRRYLPLLTDQDTAALKSMCKQLTVTKKQLTKINSLRTAAKLVAI